MIVCVLVSIALDLANLIADFLPWEINPDLGFSLLLLLLVGSAKFYETKKAGKGE